MKFSLHKQHTDTALPQSVQKELILAYASDIERMPETDLLGLQATENIVFKDGASKYFLYLTPAQKKRLSTIEGDTDVKGFIQEISGSFPGTALKVSEWIYHNLNEGFVIIQPYCSEGYSKIFGSKYNPLFITGRISEDQESSICELTFKQVKKSKKPYLIFNDAAFRNRIFDETFDLTFE
ncbi:TPA: hypothetical protein O4D88_001296 [Elizabethkingia anophelis]|nr:hypothetical protein [Elizabethkingia anophelis]